MARRSVEVCFSPKLFSEILTQGDFIVVLADILRATTSICHAFENGAKAVIPVPTIEEAKSMKAEGFLVASEQDGKKLDFADFGNSAFSFTRERVEDRTIVYCTTNGTRALDVVRGKAVLAIGAFINVTALAEWLAVQQQDVVILCSGWKNKFCLEDTLFAGYLSERLISKYNFETVCDSTHAAMDLWNIAEKDPVGYIEKAMHRQRLKSLGLDDVIPFSFTFDTTDVVPVFDGRIIRNINLK